MNDVPIKADEPICSYCDKPLTGRSGWHLSFRTPDGFMWYLHEHPCFGLAKDMPALEAKSRKLAKEPKQATMDWG